jgi:hypothetical protein
MFSNLNFFDYVIILPGLLLCFKRVAEMERYHLVRVVLLTSILSIVVILLFFRYSLPFDPVESNCGDNDHFTCTEM